MMEEDDSGIPVIDLGDILRQEEDLRLARMIIAERAEEESLDRIEDPGSLPKLRTVSKGVVAVGNNGSTMKVLRIVMEDPASGKQFIFDVGIVKAQHLMREMKRFYEQTAGN